ncbi:MAG: MBL fold metallo-hydrolase [Thermoplasmata archaeon]|nr:MBL fold metallo-hydrolase [Thermoplasmata archaeon]
MPLLELGRGRLLLDLGFREKEGLIAAYLLPGPEGWTLVETGPSSCRGELERGLGAAGIAANEVRRILVSHIHLDHAGALGSLASTFPSAELGVHRAGVPHVVDPARLVASARRAWGEAADRLWGPVEPVPAERIHALDGGERFRVEGGELEVIATPGHARHHLSFFDAPRGALLTGASAGGALAGSTRARPAIPPPDLDLELLFESLERMAARAPRELDYTHFGPVPGGAELLRAYRTSVEEWRRVALAAAQLRPEVPFVAQALREHEERLAPHRGNSTDLEARTELVSSCELAAQGLLRYFETRGLLVDGGP